MTGRPIQLVTRADDAGARRSANRAIAETVQAGLVRNVSVMAPGPALADAARMLAGLDVCIGLHVTLSSEWESLRWGPVSRPDRVPSLVRPDGTFFRTPFELLNHGPNVDEVVLEVRAQLQLLRRQGFGVRYVDEHMGVGWLPGLRARLQAVAAEEGLVYAEGLTELPKSSNTVETNDAVLDLTARLTSAAAGTYLLVAHPDFDEVEIKSIEAARHDGARVASVRDQERRVLCDPRVLDACHALGVNLCRYTDVQSPETPIPQFDPAEVVNGVPTDPRPVFESI